MHIKEIDLYTADLEGTIRFYSGSIGLETLSLQEDRVAFKAGDTVLTFIRSEAEHIYHFAFDIPNNKMLEAVQWLALRAERIANHEGNYLTVFDNWNAQSVYFYDNNSNIVEFITRFDQGINSDEPFSAALITSVSEIGLVAENPIDFGEQLAAQYPVSFYHKGPKREDFAALGDESGLFIISGQSRHWYPTETTAHAEPLSVTFADDQTLSVYKMQFGEVQ